MSLDSAIFKQAGEAGSLGSQNVTQAAFREQINAINDAVRQLGGEVLIGPSDAVVNDPLNTPYILYVNRDIGDDTLVVPVPNTKPYDYSTQEGVPDDEKDPMRRISQQRLHSGYSPARPFKTLNRAVIEAAILTSRDYLSCCDQSRNNMRVTIVVTGEMDVYNDKCPLDACANYFATPIERSWEPGPEDLIKFNPVDGGLLLPRGVSVVSMDLRKSIIRPTQVPCPVNESPTQSNRQAILKVTGQGYYYGFTFMDQCSNPSSHHLLDCFQFASKDELIEFYMKIVQKFGDVVPLSEELARVDKTEFEIVAPNPATPFEGVDTTASASPYVYNCSIRSNLGLCGIFCDGNKVEGFKSLVVAQFTGVSLQRDLNAWEKYTGGEWKKFKTYDELITKSPDDVRMKPGWRSFHVRAINNAVIQEVSVFCIGQGVHHWVDSGGEITITNSNSNFGGTAALAEGYNPDVAITDKGWTVKGIWNALNPFQKSKSFGIIPLGNIESVSGGKITLSDPLVASGEFPDQPDAVARLNFTVDGSVDEDSYIWIRNPDGPDYRAVLSKPAWTPDKPSEIRIRGSFVSDNRTGNVAPGTDEEFPPIEQGRADTVYIRRYQDTRNRDERTFWVVLAGCGDNLRDPYRDYVIRDEDDTWDKNYLSSVARTKRDQRECDQVDCVLRNANDSLARTFHSETRYYRRGDCVIKDNKHWVAAADQFGDFDTGVWNEGYVHTKNDFVPEGQILNIAPKIKFDGDLDEAENSRQLGWGISHPYIQAQWESQVDYLGLANFCRVAGIDPGLIKPRFEKNRFYDTTDFKVNFHRPSNVRMFNHAWEWAGYLNYSKALPEYQRQISIVNKWTYYFTNKNGGKCYASGFNEEGYQVTAKGLIDLATGDEIAAIDLGTVEQDVNRRPDDPDEIELQFAKAIRSDQDLDGGIQRRIDDAEGIVHIARIEEAVSKPLEKADVSGEPYTVYFNNKLDQQGLGVLKKPFLQEYLKDKSYIRAPDESVSVVVLHVVPEGVTPLTGGNSVPFGYPVDQWTRFNSDRYEDYGSPKTITEAMRAAAGIYVPVGAEIVISLHGSINSAEKGPLQLINSYAPCVVAGARGVESPQIVLNKGFTANALDRFPQFNEYSFSAGITFADCTLNVTGGGGMLTFNGGLGVGGSNLIVDLFETGNMPLINASTSESCRLQIYHDANGPDRGFYFTVHSWSPGIADKQKFFALFGPNSEPDERVGTGQFGSSVDIKIDLRKVGYGRDGNAKAIFSFDHRVDGQPKASFLNMGGRGGCRTGGRVGAEIDFNFNNRDWDLSWWIGRAWRQNQNYHGPHFGTRRAAGRETFQMTQATLVSLTAQPCILTMGSCLDPNGNDFQAGPFGLIREGERITDQNGDLILAENDFGSYIYDYDMDERNQGKVPGSPDARVYATDGDDLD